MPHRAHLFSLRIGHALRESCLKTPSSREHFKGDLLAGLTVGLIAIPLAMALALASGVAPQHGLYTAAIAGFVIALTGGSRFNVSGPTAAFVVILYPITQQYGLGGLLLAGLLAGCMLIIMALLRLGRLIEYIPEPVTLGFTGGIAVVIATLQIKDLLGLPLAAMPEHYVDKIHLLAQSIQLIHWPSVTVAMVTLAVMLLWPRLKTAIPAHLPAVVLGALLALALNQTGFPVDTIDSRFSYTLSDGRTGQGIPPILPSLQWPWHQPGADGAPLTLNWDLLKDLLPAAFAIAMLGAIESLLCAVVLDGMSGKRHSANSELLGQGIGNIVVPFFGGITATAAIARSAANFKAGAQSPVAAVIHALVVVLGLVALAPLLGYLPMAGMAALLIMVAWNMSEAPKSLHLFKSAQASDRWIFLCCFALTVLFDMVIAITAGIVLAAMLFMKQMAELTRLVEITDTAAGTDGEPVAHVRVFKITGPLFFAAADKIFGELAQYCEEHKTLILDMEQVSLLDAGGVSALTKLIAHCRSTGTQLLLIQVQFQPLKTLVRARVEPVENTFRIHRHLNDAIQTLRSPY